MTIDPWMPAHALLGLLKSREVSAADLVAAAIARIEAVNPKLNAVIATDFDRARARATAIDGARAKGERVGPLAGLPITVKDAFEVEGLSAQNGVPALADYRSPATAPAVQRLLDAGAILLGKTNVPMLSGDFQTFNAVTGTTNNPWNLAMTPGGSSGGAAAAIAAGLSALELGTDLGGSIRWPAHACGVFGLKPTTGVVPMSRVLPPMPGVPVVPTVQITVAGPLARSAKDLELALGVLAGPEIPTLSLTLPPPPGRHDKLRAAFLRDHPIGPTQQAVRQGIITAAAALGQAGVEADEIGPEALPLADIHRVFSTLLYALITPDFPAKVRTFLIEKAKSVAADDPSAEAAQARGAALSFAGFRDLLVERAAIEAAFTHLFERYDVLLVPPATTQAFPHDQRPFTERRLDIDGTLRPATDFNIWSSLAGLARLPAAVAPVGPAENGLPTGVQIIAPMYHEHRAIHVAGLIEAVLGVRWPAIG